MTQAPNPQQGDAVETVEPVAWRWSETGTDTDSDPKQFTGEYGDYVVVLTLSRTTGFWSYRNNRGDGKLGFLTETDARAHAVQTVEAMAASRIATAKDTLAIFAAPPAAPVAQQGDGESGTDDLHAAIVRLRTHVQAVQVVKKIAGTAPVVTNPIIDCINDLPAIIRALEAAEFQIEADFERYEDAAPVTPPREAWRPIETAPRDGTVFMVIGAGYDWPEIVRWETYADDVAEEAGAPGYWSYAEPLLNNVTDSPGDDEWTHWMPLPEGPAGPGEGG